MALLSVGLGLPGVPSAAGVVIASFAPFTAVIVTSTLYVGPGRPTITVARAGGFFGKCGT